MPFPAVEEQLALIRRGVEKIVPEEELAEKLRQSRNTDTPLRIKYGIDPTGVDLHLGHTVPMRKMRQFQQLGHQAVIIIGNYTALVGDPSGRDETRPRMTSDQVEANAKKYLEQVGKVIDLSKAQTVELKKSDQVQFWRRIEQKAPNPVVVRNGDWFRQMSFAEILDLFSKVTLRQLLTREDFKKRFEDMDNPRATIFMHEMFYPVMQAWDSVKVGAHVELGGTEQLYSFMLARHLQHWEHLPQQVGVMSPILVGLDGVRRMGKSLGNYIGVSEPPFEMMKKFMQLPDGCMRQYFELLTDVPLEEVDRLLAGHPKEAKITLAKTIIAEYHSPQEAQDAAERWRREIGAGERPQDVPVVAIPSSALTDGAVPAATLLKLAGLVSSTSEARRLIAQGGAKYGEEETRIQSHDQPITVEDGLFLRAGKKRFCRLELTE